MTKEKLESAVSMLMENEISPEVFAQLQAHLRASEEARRSYRNLTSLHFLLYTEEGGLALDGPGGPIPMNHILARQKRRTLRAALLVGAAAVAAAFVVSMLITLPDAPAARVKGSSLADYSITHPPSEEAATPEEDALAVGSRLRVNRGVIELTFKSGVTGVVRAPADLTIVEEGLTSLKEGIAWFEVPSRAAGFQVETPDLLLTDLGTRFGVVSNRTAGDEVHVFAGQVEIESRRGASPLPPVRLSSDSARLAKPDGGWEVVEVDPAQFFTALPSQTPLPPYLHWSFDGPDAAAVGGEHPERDTIRSSGPAGRDDLEQVPGRVGQALRLGPSSGRIGTDWKGIGGARSRSIAFWVKIPKPQPDAQPHDKTILSWGGPYRGTGHCAMQLLARDRTGEVNYTPSMVFDQFHVNTKEPLAYGEWHHVALVYGSQGGREGNGTVKIFVDGENVTADQTERFPRVDTDISSEGALPLQIATPRSGIDKWFEGAIDELYIFDGRIGQGVIDELANPSPLSAQTASP